MDDFQHIAIGQRVLRVHATGQGTPIVYLHGGLGSIHERPAARARAEIAARAAAMAAAAARSPEALRDGILGTMPEIDRALPDDVLAMLAASYAEALRGDGGAIDEMIGCARRGRSRWPRSAVRSRSGPDSSTATRRRPVRSSWSTRCPARATTSCPGADII